MKVESCEPHTCMKLDLFPIPEPDCGVLLSIEVEGFTIDRPHTQMMLLAAMDAAYADITADGWTGHSKILFPQCIARDDICCDVNVNALPDRKERLEV